MNVYSRFRVSVRWQLVCLLAICTWSLSFAGSMPAVDDGEPVLSPRIYHRLTHIKSDFEAERFTEALTLIEKLIPTTRDGNRYDRAVLLQLLGQIRIRMEQPEKAVAAFEQVAALQVLVHEDSLNLERELARLYVITERYADAASILERLPELDRDGRLLLAQSYLQLKRYRDALKPLRGLIRDDPAPNKSLYEALFVAQHALGEIQAAIATLKHLIYLDPDAPTYWRQMAALHHERGRPDRALAVLEAAYQQGVLNGSADDLLNLVNLYRTEGAPYKAAEILARLLDERQLNNRIALRERLVDLWLAARETARAAEALEQLIEYSPTAHRWLRLGELRIHQRHWSAAIQALKTAIGSDTGDKRLSTKALGKAWLWLGIVYFENGRQQAAHSAFRHSERFVLTRTIAQQWLRYLESSG